MTATLGLEALHGRCPQGFAEVQHPAFCQCADLPLGAITAEEWATFTAALRQVVRDGEIHQCDVRPLIRGRIAPKHIGLCWKRARRLRLVEEVRHERSDDTAGRNSHRMEPVYELRAA